MAGLNNNKFFHLLLCTMQRIKLVFFSCLLMMCGVSVFAQDTTIYSQLNLKQSIEIALANNIPVKQTGLQVERAQVDKNQAKANLLPFFNANFNYGFNTGRTIDPITNSYVNQQLQSSNPTDQPEWLQRSHLVHSQ